VKGPVMRGGGGVIWQRGGKDRTIGNNTSNPTDPRNLPLPQWERREPRGLGLGEEGWVLNAPNVKGWGCGRRWAFDGPSVRRGGGKGKDHTGTINRDVNNDGRGSVRR
jgi:hypothetical protein